MLNFVNKKSKFPTNINFSKNPRFQNYFENYQKKSKNYLFEDFIAKSENVKKLIKLNI